jgi:hypothetical protein
VTVSPAGFLALALCAPGSPPEPPPLPGRGEELLYAGTVTEAVDRPGSRFRRSHELEVRVLTLGCRDGAADLAVLTLLRRADDGAVTGAVGPVVGAKHESALSPPAARLDLVRTRWPERPGGATWQRETALLAPPAALPLAVGPDTPTRPLPAVPLDTFAPFEFGPLPPLSASRAPREQIVRLSARGRPDEVWKFGPDEVIAGERCARLEMIQHTPDWYAPVGGQTAWLRTDVVWVSARDETVRRVQRVIRQRDGVGAPGVRIETRYELKEQVNVPGRAYDRRRREIELAYATAAEIAPLLPDAAKHGPRLFEARLARLDQHVREDDAGTPYREAVLAVRRQLEAARAGESAPAIVPPPTVMIPVVPGPRSEAVAIGKPAPDFQTGAFRLADHRGKPAVLVFFKPGTVTTDPSLAIADALQKRYGGRAAVAPLVVFADPAAGAKDRDRLNLTVAVYDGAAAGRLYGVETFPRFLVVDAAGVLRWAFAGVGPEVGYLVREQVDALLTPTAATVAPVGTAYPAGPTVTGTPGRP